LTNRKNSIPAGDSKRLKLISDYYNKLIPILYNNDPLGIFGSAKKIAVKVKGFKDPLHLDKFQEKM
jgi:hypothetical protein